MTTIQRNAIVAPVAGLQILNLDDYCLDVYNGIGWIKNCGYKMTGTDTAELSITTVASFGGVARDHAAGFAIGSKGYVGTGFDGTNKKDFWEYNPATNVWTQKADFGGTARSGAVGFAVSTKGYIGTGLDGAFKNDMWEYDPTPNTWTQKANLPASGRTDATAFSIGTYGYVGLGYNGGTNTMYQDMYEFNPATNSWGTKTNCPAKMHNLISFASSTLGYLGIGELRSTFFGDYLSNFFYQFNPAGPGTWTQMPDFPGSVRWNAVAVGINNIGYVTTGKNYSATYFSDVWQFNTNSNTWAPMPDISTAGRARAVAFAVNGAMYVGTGYDGAYKSDFIKYEPYPIGPVYENTLDVMAAGGISDGIWTKEFNKISTDNRININTDLRSLTHPTDRPFYLTGNLGYSSNGVEFCRNDGRQGIGFGYGFIYAAGTDATVDLGITAKGSDGDLLFYTNNAERFRITPSGNVGIGVFPHAALQFSNSVANRKIVMYESANDDHQFFGFGINNNILRYQVGATSTDHVFYAGVNGTTSNELMRIKGNGTVGIGTNNPATKLEVKTTANQYGFSHTDGNVQLSSYTGLGGEIGTVSNHSLYLYANNALDQFQLMPNGNVSMGQPNPLNKLDIRSGAARTGTHATGLAMYLTGDLQSASGGLEVRHANGTQGIGIGLNTIYATGSNADQNLSLAARGTTGALLFQTNNVDRVRINGSGEVGIGLSNPLNKLDVASGAARTGSHASGRPMYITGSLSDAANGVEIRDADGAQGIGLGRNTIYAAGSSADQNIGLAGKGTGGNVLFTTNNTERMRVNGAGQVGIGTMFPHAQLQLATSVANRKIILYEVADNDHQYHGFGINGDGALRYQTANTLNDHVFYASTSSTTSNELARIKGNGNLAVTGIIETEAFIAPTLLNTFTVYGVGYASPGYYKDKMGRVHLRGLVANVNNPAGLVIFTLPVGYRPATSGILIFPTLNNSSICRIDILANGNVVVNFGASGWVSLDGIDFRAD